MSSSNNSLDALDDQRPDDEQLDTNQDDKPSRRAIPLPPDDRRCTAKSHQTQERCRQWASPPSSVCRFHGARALKGVAAPNFKHGRYSKVLPMRLRENFLAALGDPELDNLRRQIAVCEARELELLERLDTGESGAAWREMGKRFDAMTRAFERGEEAEVGATIKAMDEILNVGEGDERQWKEIHENMEVRRRLVETERKRSEFLQANVTPEMMAAFVARISVLIGEEVKDRNVLSRIADGIRAAAFGERYFDDAIVAEVLEANLPDSEPRDPAQLSA